MLRCCARSHLLEAELHHRHVGVELVVNARLLHRFLQVVVEEERVQDHLKTARGRVSADWLRVCKTEITLSLTRAVAVVIFVPPDAPTTILTRLFLSKMMVGHIEDSGLLPATRDRPV